MSEVVSFRLVAKNAPREVEHGPRVAAEKNAKGVPRSFPDQRQKVLISGFNKNHYARCIIAQMMSADHGLPDFRSFGKLIRHIGDNVCVHRTSSSRG
ncbi:hypothetical protein GRAN_1529 [Granulicella sibirica]|uniref:Uncharacterized protein n=1 Tax=Granulicella sibirica TaxID=2479048 RepID=A0A4Q0T856_9BACT|nr:hypothetical protein GRAN_1529 [Granulicella sibirica]